MNLTRHILHLILFFASASATSAPSDKFPINLGQTLVLWGEVQCAPVHPIRDSLDGVAAGEAGIFGPVSSSNVDSHGYDIFRMTSSRAGSTSDLSGGDRGGEVVSIFVMTMAAPA
jgi:hypothetical protein